ncbi:MAG TPA: BPSS1780 family membrane protein [Parasulfuritortus sp.]
MKQLTVARPNAGQGIAWMKAGWNWFRLAPIPWMGMTALAFLVLTGIGMLPRLGGFVVELLSPFMVVAFMSAARAAEENQPVTFLHLTAGFRPEVRTRLLIMGAVYLAGLLLVDTIMRQMGGESFQQMALLAQNPKSIDPEQAQAIMSQALPAMLTGLLLMTPLMMATWFAPALILFDGFSAINAMWWSLWAGMVNWRPVLIYGLWLSLVGVAAMLIPFGLGLLVLLPWVMTSTYAAYRAMFVTVESV